jgi:hypothetical protein
VKTKVAVLTIISVFAVFAAVWALPLLSVQAQDDTIACSMEFEATVYHGPSEGLSVLGTLEMEIDETGSLTGTMTSEDGSLVLPVVGQANGRAVNMAFNLGEGVYIFGIGTAVNDTAGEDCGGVLGGPLVGPNPGDSGDWLICDAAAANCPGASEEE